MAERVVLKDGTHAVIRPIRPDGVEKLRKAIRELTPESRYRRFFTTRENYTATELAPFVLSDGWTMIGLVAVPLDESGKELEPIGVAHSIREHPDSVEAEVAVAVADHWQGKGVGSALVQALAKAAYAADVRYWHATLLPDNAAALALLRQVGKVERIWVCGATTNVLVKL